eukprot:7379241-Prymnesium_polylepis.1
MPPCAWGLVVARIAVDVQVRIHVATFLAQLVLNRLAEKRPEEARRRAGDHKEGEPKRQGQHTPHTGDDGGAECRFAFFAKLHKLPDDEARPKDDQDDDWPE